MEESLRNYRRAELRGTCLRNPQQIIGLYRVAAGLEGNGPLPHGLTVNNMIETILDTEERDSKSSGVLRAIAG